MNGHHDRAWRRRQIARATGTRRTELEADMAWRMGDGLAAMARRIAHDWRGLTPKAHAASLLADIRAVSDPWLYAPAFVRLRFYHPKIYAGLRGADAAKRVKFEAYEQAERALNP